MREYQEKGATRRHSDNDENVSQATSRHELDNYSEDDRDEDTAQRDRAGDDETDDEEDEMQHKPITEETETWTVPDTTLA